MGTKTLKQVMKKVLDDLSQRDFENFVEELVDRQGERKVTRNRVEGQSRPQVVNAMVSTFTEEGAFQVAVELLNEIDCSGFAERLKEQASGLVPKPGPRDTAGPSGPSGPSGASSANSNADDEHFVDKHQLELIKRVSTIGAILDELWAKKVIKPETYNEIRALRTSHEKMRELYAGPLQASRACKDIFYKILEDNEPYLIEDLKEKN